MKAIEALNRLSRKLPLDNPAWTDEDRDYIHTIITALEEMDQREKAELSRRPYTVVQRRYGQFYGVDYESASVGLTLYVDEDQDKAEAMYHKLDAMTPEQMKSYIETR